MTRVDERLVAEGKAESIALARALVMAGRVYINERKVEKPSQPIKPAERLEVRGELAPYVSRGAKKLKKAMEVFGIDVRGMTCIDVGASTGGFTDVMLRGGAEKVYSVDVGYNQLDYRLRSDARVVAMERQNARYLTPDMFDKPLEFGATDVSFISLKLILPVCFSLMDENARFVALIKPQFEAKKEEVGEKGVVRDKQVHMRVVRDIIEFVNSQPSGWRVTGLDYSPITGPEGNMEFLIEMRKNCSADIDELHICNVIDEAHNNFIK